MGIPGASGQRSRASRQANWLQTDSVERQREFAMTEASPAVLAPEGTRNFAIFTAIVSAAALAFLAYILVFREADASGGLNLRFMPAVNASLNALSATLLTAGWWSIRKKNRVAHQYLMVSAFVVSALFLVGYLAYHYVHGDTRYTGTGALRAVYFAILISHILLSTLVVPLALFAFFFAWRKAWNAHRRVTRVLAPAWLYVSVTGVVIYFMLRGSPPAVM